MTSLKSYIEKHKNLSYQLIDLIKEEKLDSNSIFQNLSTTYKTTDTLEKQLKSNGIYKSKKIAALFNEIQRNTEEYVISIPNFKSLGENHIVDLIISEIDKTYSFSKNHECSCYCIKRRAYDRCERNFLISLGGVGVSAIFTFGIGTVIGAGVAGAIVLTCISDANEDYRQCTSALED